MIIYAESIDEVCKILQEKAAVFKKAKHAEVAAKTEYEEQLPFVLIGFLLVVGLIIQLFNP